MGGSRFDAAETVVFEVPPRSRRWRGVHRRPGMFARLLAAVLRGGGAR